MNVLLLVGKTSTSHEAVAADAEELRRQGHRVTLGTRVPPLPVLEAAVDAVVLLDPRLPAPSPAPTAGTAAPSPAATQGVPAAAPAAPSPAATQGVPAAAPAAPSPAAAPSPGLPASQSPTSSRSAAPPDPLRRAVGTARRRVRRLRGQVSGAVTEPARSWRSVRRNPQLLEAAARADVVVAVDAPMVRAAWHLGQRLPLPDGPEVVYGLPAAASALSRRAAHSS